MREASRILAVDDNPLNLEVIEGILEDGYDFRRATTGEEALEIAIDFQPEILVLDVMLPDISGYEVCRNMRARPDLWRTKIVMISARGMPSDRLKGYEAGADDYIVKPFDADELLAKMRVYLRLSALEKVDCRSCRLQWVINDIRNMNQELREFAHTAAYSLKTPLQGIGSLVESIATDYSFDEEGKERVGMLVAEVRQMSIFVNRLLEYSKLGRTSIVTQQVDLAEVLSGIISTIAPPESVEIILESELPCLECDVTHITQIFQNLLSNAVKYADKPQGQIKVDCAEQSGCWVFSVADNGPGIDEKHWKNSLQIFQTPAARDGIHRTGMGLSIVRKIIDLNGGKVWVESEAGKGSTFFFAFPKPGCETGDNAKLEVDSVCQ